MSRQLTESETLYLIGLGQTEFDLNGINRAIDNARGELKGWVDDPTPSPYVDEYIVWWAARLVFWRNEKRRLEKVLGQ